MHQRDNEGRAGNIETTFTRILQVLAVLIWLFFGLTARGQDFKIEQVTTGSTDHRSPGINNPGEIIWTEIVGGDKQIFSSIRGQLTSPLGQYAGAENPSISDDGSFVCFRPFGIYGDVVRYPNGRVYEFSTRNAATGSRRNPVQQSGISSSGKVIWGREFYQFGSISTRRFFVDGTEVSLPSTQVDWKNPSVNANGDFAYDSGGAVYIRNNGDTASTLVDEGSQPYINNLRDIAYVSGSEVRVLYHGGERRTVGAGADPSINSDGIIVFERQVDGFYQIFRARPAVATLHRFDPEALVFNPSDGIDQPLDVRPDASLLDTQPRIGGPEEGSFGLVADGVTPLLIKIFLISPPSPGTTLTLDMSEISGGSIASGSVNQRLRVLGPSGFSSGTVLTPTGDTGFAFLSAFRAEDILLDANQTELTVQLTIRGPAIDLTNKFKIRKPPVVLVHGYATGADTWSSDFLGQLYATRPEDFVIPLQYGVEGTDVKYFPNSYERLDNLSKRLDSILRLQIELASAPWRSSWALSRYDVVAHSQGGVLIRMLCSRTGVFGTTPLMGFRSEKNFHRGRFRRVITIGSPHNGSVPLYYANRILQSGSGGSYRAIPTILRNLGLLQLKFDPWGEQMREINNPLGDGVDEQAQFHALATAIGNTSIPPWYRSVGLGFPPRRAIVIPSGSDGVVNFDSQKGGTGTLFTELPTDIAHAPAPSPLATTYLFGLSSPDDTQTRSRAVSEKAMQLLDGSPSEFNKFVVPSFLSDARKADVDSFVPKSIAEDLLNPTTAPFAIQTSPVNIQLTALAGEPIDGEVVWNAEVFGTNGVSSSGADIQIDNNDTTRVTVGIPQSVVGDVVLYASYTSANGNVIFAHPYLVATLSDGGSLTNIEIIPPRLVVGKGVTVEPEIWGTYSSGIRRALYIPYNKPVELSSSDTNVVAITNEGLIVTKGFGAAIVNASLSGLTNSLIVSVLPDGVHPMLRLFSLQQTEVTFELIGRPKANYRIDGSNDLASWVPLTNIVTDNGFQRFTWPQVGSESSHFFRAAEM